MVRRSLAVACLFALPAILLPACDDSSVGAAVARAELAEGCTLDSDCVSPLRCAFQRCHMECQTSRDCTGGLRCVQANKPFRICELAEQVHCSLNSDCVGTEICAGDGQCRDQCASVRDCGPGQLCISSSCREADEATAGPQGTDASTDGRPSVGLVCYYNSDCAPGLVCRDGACTPECLGAADCPSGLACIAERCVDDIPDAAVREGGDK